MMVELVMKILTAFVDEITEPARKKVEWVLVGLKDLFILIQFQKH